MSHTPERRSNGRVTGASDTLLEPMTPRYRSNSRLGLYYRIALAIDPEMLCKVSTLFGMIRRSPTSIAVLEIESSRSIFDHILCLCQNVFNLFFCTICDLDWHMSFRICHIVETELMILSACSIKIRGMWRTLISCTSWIS